MTVPTFELYTISSGQNLSELRDLLVSFAGDANLVGNLRVNYRRLIDKVGGSGEYRSTNCTIAVLRSDVFAAIEAAGRSEYSRVHDFGIKPYVLQPHNYPPRGCEHALYFSLPANTTRVETYRYQLMVKLHFMVTYGWITEDPFTIHYVSSSREEENYTGIVVIFDFSVSYENRAKIRVALDQTWWHLPGGTVPAAVERCRVSWCKSSTLRAMTRNRRTHPMSPGSSALAPVTEVYDWKGPVAVPPQLARPRILRRNPSTPLAPPKIVIPAPLSPNPVLTVDDITPQHEAAESIVPTPPTPQSMVRFLDTAIASSLLPQDIQTISPVSTRKRPPIMVIHAAHSVQ